MVEERWSFASDTKSTCEGGRRGCPPSDSRSWRRSSRDVGESSTPGKMAEEAPHALIIVQVYPPINSFLDRISGSSGENRPYLFNIFLLTFVHVLKQIKTQLIVVFFIASSFFFPFLWIYGKKRLSVKNWNYDDVKFVAFWVSHTFCLLFMLDIEEYIVCFCFERKLIRLYTTINQLGKYLSPMGRRGDKIEKSSLAILHNQNDCPTARNPVFV